MWRGLSRWLGSYFEVVSFTLSRTRSAVNVRVLVAVVAAALDGLDCSRHSLVTASAQPVEVTFNFFGLSLDIVLL